MKKWIEYEGHLVDIKGQRNKYDNTIYTFDIETTSYLILNGKQLNTKEYLKLNKQDKENVKAMATMYIWQFGVNDEIYYGRTWRELYLFLQRLEWFGTDKKKFY